MSNCTIPCDPDCDSKCHGLHQVWWKKEHPDFWCQLDSEHRRDINVEVAKALAQVDSNRKAIARACRVSRRIGRTLRKSEKFRKTL